MRLARLAKYVAAAVLSFAMAVCIGTLLPRPFFPAEAGDLDGVTIFVATNPIHTDIIIPADNESRAAFAFLGDTLALNNPNVKWLMFGWGGRSFYIETPTWSQLKAGPVFRALTVDAAAMHVQLLGDLRTDDPTLIAVQISKDGLLALQRDMLASFRSDAGGAPQLIAGSAYGAYDQFYEANGYFNALIGCNTWTARMLRVAGTRTGVWNPFPQSLRLSLNLYN
jgi:uncharacterized protein (TIGR02117 family)